MSTFLHYVHCKDALLDCSAPGGERCESLTWVDEINCSWSKAPSKAAKNNGLIVLITAQLGVVQPDWGQREVRKITPGSYPRLWKLGWWHSPPYENPETRVWGIVVPTMDRVVSWLYNANHPCHFAFMHTLFVLTFVFLKPMIWDDSLVALLAQNNFNEEL